MSGRADLRVAVCLESSANSACRSSDRRELTDSIELFHRRATYTRPDRRKHTGLPAGEIIQIETVAPYQPHHDHDNIFSFQVFQWISII